MGQASSLNTARSHTEGSDVVEVPSLISNTNKYEYNHHIQQVSSQQQLESVKGTDIENNEQTEVPSHWVMKDKKLVEFLNPWGEFKNPASGDVFKFQRDMAKNKPVIPTDEELPQIKPNYELLFSPQEQSLNGDATPQVTWIGHSTFLIQYRGVNILTDPVFSDRCSPVSFMGPKRIKPLPIEIEKLPTIHFVVVSHNHYDHLDYAAFTKIQEHHDPVFLLPLKMKYSWMEKFYEEKKKSLIAKTKLVELDWWKSSSFNVRAEKKSDENVKIESNVEFTFLPAQHWGLRSGFDRNEALWGSWGIEFTHLKDNVVSESEDNIKKFKLWFAGDTGYNHTCFKEIGTRYGPIDLSFIPIGAYEPRWFMKYQHVNPDDAVQVAVDTQSKLSIGMHWGTFILTLEPIMQPKIDLEKSLKERNLDPNSFVVMAHGETNLFSNTQQL